MSNIAAREAWRAHSIISPAVKATIQGLGWRSYTAGLRALVETLRDAPAMAPVLAPVPGPAPASTPASA